MTHSSKPKKDENPSNRLIHEKSPYLLQHAHNPVNWLPWGHEAFEKAHRENKPIFLSIGYSTCHWCHVMEKESFEDPEVAGLLNETFVSIKVDREERPDLDHVYMTACQMLTGSGGWPLTIVMTPDKRPFFAATYIPKGSRFGRTGMMELIPRLRDTWRTRRDEVLASAESITQSLQGLEKESQGGDLDRSVLDRAYEELSKRFDKTYGGFSNAPKFPTPHNFFFMLRFWKRTGNSEALKMVEKTLQKIRWGGIYDQVGFGFHRYSTDREWLVPHFEKMLYDQAMLALAYLETYQAAGEGVYGDTAREIFEYVLRDMTSPEGAFYSAEDADSEGEEGKFYVWTREELRQILGEEEADLIAKVFHVEKSGNFREEATGENTGANILYLGRPISEIAADLGMPRPDLEKAMESARKKLFEARKKRVHPHKDDKVLTDWNGLMIAAFARGA
ncbi:MAG: thioredoxin domain-containing protein, partial [Pseudomonadota bacterium]